VLLRADPDRADLPGRVTSGVQRMTGPAAPEREGVVAERTLKRDEAATGASTCDAPSSGDAGPQAGVVPSDRPTPPTRSGASA